jgi:hypothetical protein
MNLITYCAFRRHIHLAPIVFSDLSVLINEAGEMINLSHGGMVFLAGHELKPGEEIDIKILEDTPDYASLEPNHNYGAEVRWCENRDGGETSNYRVGIRLLLANCRLCGKEIHLHAVGEKHLCEDCHDYISSLLGGTIKVAIEDYIEGNVL